MGESYKVLEGKNGFLFLTGDSNRVLNQICGGMALSCRSLDKWKACISDRLEHAKAHNYIYKFLIIPNKHCVYNQFLPDGIEIADSRPAVQLAEAMPNDVVYPLAYLRSMSGKSCEGYFRTDTHWNYLGCVLFMNSFASSINSVALKFETYAMRNVCGDLGSKLTPPRNETTNAVIIKNSGRLEFDNMVRLGRMVWTGGTGIASLPVGVAFCDSFFNSMQTIIASYFNRLYAFTGPIFDKKIIELIKPDVVISENVERFVNSPPEQSIFSSFKDFVYRRIFHIPYDEFRQKLNHVFIHEPYSGMDYTMLNAYAALYSHPDKDKAEENRLDFLIKNQPCQIPDNTVRPFSGNGWWASKSNKFKKWLVGFATQQTQRPRGVTFYLEGVRDNSRIDIQLYEAVSNAPRLIFSELRLLYSKSFSTKDLFLYADMQEVFFKLEALILMANRAFYMAIEGDANLGMGMGPKDRQPREYFLRGYFALDNWNTALPVAGCSSISWRLLAG